MKMGIERVLKENFANLGPVISVDANASASDTADTGLTMGMVEKALEKVLPAIKGLGGNVEISAIDSASGLVRLRYTGPARLKLGIELVLKDVAMVKLVQIDVEDSVA